MKTVAELNNKWWYRLVKVIFIGVNLVCVLIAIFIIYDNNKPRQVKDYKVNCIANYTNKSSFFAEKDAGILIYTYGLDTIYDALTEEHRLKIKNMCHISQKDAAEATNKAKLYIETEAKKGTSHDDIQKGVDDNYRPYKVSEDYTIKGSNFIVFVYSIFTLLTSLFVIEISRRIFYYIFLGTIKPSK